MDVVYYLYLMPWVSIYTPSLGCVCLSTMHLCLWTHWQTARLKINKDFNNSSAANQHNNSHIAGKVQKSRQMFSKEFQPS